MAKRIALITGGMGGLGQTISTKMHEVDDTVVVTYSPGNQQAGRLARGHEESRLRLSRLRGRCRRTLAHVSAPWSESTKRIGPIDVLVNNAGITRDMTFSEDDKSGLGRGHPHQPGLGLQHDKAGLRRNGGARLGTHHQRLLHQRAEGCVRPDELLRRQGWHARIHQGARA